MNAHFKGYSVHAGLQPPDDLVEYLHIAVLDEDPNGKGLLGADNSLGKDVGNRILSEDLSGFNAARAALGQPGYGGVFLGGVFIFSRQLHPSGSASVEAFDELFAAYAPVLGGVPAPRDTIPALAIDAAADLIAHTAVHEIGHALGMAAIAGQYHHADDNPGWMMDTGDNRRFVERVALPEASPQIWGPIDSAYLAGILPAP